MCVYIYISMAFVWLYLQAVHHSTDCDPKEEDSESKEAAKLGKLHYTLDYNFTDSAV